MGSKELEWVREKAKTELESAFWLAIAEKRDAAILANIAIVLLKQEDYLLFKQLEALEKQLKSGGDLHARVQDASQMTELERYKKESAEAATFGYPRCPKCGKAMRTGGPAEGAMQKWECSDCRETKLIDAIESIVIERERRKKMMEVKFRFDKLLRRLG